MTLSRRSFLRLGGLTAAGFATGGTGYVSRSNAIQVTRTAVDLPGTGPGFTIALVTDVHAPQPGLDFDALAREVNEFLPDIVVIGGDAINRRGDEGLVEWYGDLHAKVAKYAVPGNWENWGRVRRGEIRDQYARAGTAWLDNTATDVAVLGVRVVGLDESLNGHADWSLLARAPTDRPTIVLHHSPASFDSLPMPAGSTVLMLSGHTHGGQVAPLGFPLVLPPGCGRYIQGAYARGRHRLYVSRGIGNSHVPVRIGARPELALLQVRRAS